MKNKHKIILIALLFTFFIFISSTSIAAPEEILPVADFSANPSSGNAPLSVQFTDSSQDSTGWNWDFGDGDNSIAKNPEHTYTKTGNYVVNLTVNNENGTDSKTLEITVDEAPIEEKILPVDFTADATSGPSPLKVQFTSTVTGNPTDYFWVFEPETNSDWNSKHAVTAGHTFTKPGV